MMVTRRIKNTITSTLNSCCIPTLSVVTTSVPLGLEDFFRLRLEGLFGSGDIKYILEVVFAKISGFGSAVTTTDIEPVEDYGVTDEDEDYENGAGCWVGD